MQKLLYIVLPRRTAVSKKVATTRKNATSVTNKKGLKAGKTYYYKIATIKGKLISAMSKAKRVKIKK